MAMTDPTSPQSAPLAPVPDPAPVPAATPGAGPLPDRADGAPAVSPFGGSDGQ